MLERVANKVLLENIPARRIDLSSLTTVGGNCRFDSTAVEELRLDSLRTVGGRFGFAFNSTLTLLDLPELTYVGELLAVDWTRRLTHVEVPKLTHASDVEYYYNTMLPGCEAIQLSRRLGVPCKVCRENAGNSCN